LLARLFFFFLQGSRAPTHLFPFSLPPSPAYRAIRMEKMGAAIGFSSLRPKRATAVTTAA